MSKKLGAALAIALAMAWAQAHSAPVTYKVSATGEKGSKLTGSITLVDGALGEIGRDEILSWSFESVGDFASDTPTFSVSGSGGLPGVDCDPVFCFFATASELSDTAPTGDTAFGGVTTGGFSGQVFLGNNNISWKCIQSPPVDCSGSDLALLPANRVFARADPTAPVPEPGSLALAGAALAAAFVVAGRRNRRGSTAAT
jgi:hypothetical protein